MGPGDVDLFRRALGARPARVAEARQGVSWAAVALILARGEARELDALLILRAQREGDPWSGHVALPGGRRDRLDPDLEATARRETREETGIELAEPFGQLDDLGPVSRSLPPLAVRPYVYALEERPEVRANHEVAGALWTPLAQLRAERVPSKVLVGGEEREVRSLRLGPHVLWGMTLSILDGFVERIEAG